MARRWTYDEDRFLHAYFDGVGAFIGKHDLGRSEKATVARVNHLKDCGAWSAIDRELDAHNDYLKALGLWYEGDLE
jgi:hypothetical protein